jgi:hypothetical protein
VGLTQSARSIRLQTLCIYECMQRQYTMSCSLVNAEQLSEPKYPADPNKFETSCVFDAQVTRRVNKISVWQTLFFTHYVFSEVENIKCTSKLGAA